MTRRLIILGASVRAAAFSSIRAGFAPHAIDCFADRDLAAVCPAVKIERYPRDFEAALAAASQAPWIYTGGLENYSRLVERLAALRPLWGNLGSGLREVRNPRLLAEVAQQAGLRFPRTSSRILPTDQPVRWLVKRLHSSGGLGVRFARETDRTSLERGSYYQEHIDGQAASATFVAAHGRAALLGTAIQLLGRDVGMADRPFFYAGSIAPLVLGDDELARLGALGSRLAEQFGLVGLFGVDFIRTSDDLWLIEVNPRYTASVEVLERSTGVSFLALHAGACENKEIPFQTPIRTASFAGKQVVYARNHGRVPAAFDWLVDEFNQPGQPKAIADLPRVGEPIAAGQPVATVLAEGGSTTSVQAMLNERASRVVGLLTPDS